MERALRQEIESVDSELKIARAELAAARELAAQVPAERAEKSAALRRQLAANRAALDALATAIEGLEDERKLLRRQITEGRSVVSSHQPLSGPVTQPSTTLKDVLRPTGWRTSQPWYARLLWWIFDAKEW